MLGRPQSRDIITLPLQIIEGMVVIARTPAYLVPCLVPLASGVVSFAIMVWIAFAERYTIVELAMGQRSEWLSFLLSWIAFFLAVALASLASIIVASLAGGIFLEILAEKLLERESMLPPRPSSAADYAIRMARALRDSLLGAACLASVGALALVTGLFPPLLPLSAAIGCFALGYNAFDMPLSVMGVRFRTRLRIAREHIPVVLALGGLSTLSLAIPFGAALFVPLAQYAAIKQLSRWEIPGAERAETSERK